jgi:putative peptidoglycan lipid II flippase
MVICLKDGCMPGLTLPKLTPQVKTMLLLMAPAALGSGVQQLNLLVDVIIASHIPDAVSYLYYADRITELPIGVIGVAIGTVLLPMLSRQIKAGDLDAARNQMNRALELVLLFGLPATAGLLVMAEPVIRVLYLHGAFTEHDMAATTMALIAFTAGLPAFLAVKIFAPGFFASHDTKTPFKIAMVCVFINLVLNLLLIHPFAHVGMAMATTIASWVNVLLMARILHKRKIFVPDALLKKRLLKMAAAAKIMALVLYIVGMIVAPFYLEGMVVRTVMLLAVIGGGMVVYGSIVISMKAYDAGLLKRLLLRKSKAA